MSLAELKRIVLDNPEIMQEARYWVAEYFPGEDPDDFSDQEIICGLNRHHEGSLESFLFLCGFL